MNFPSELKYTKDHEWIRVEGDEAVIGITDFAQRELGDIVFVDINTVGEEVAANEVFGTIEAVKTVLIDYVENLKDEESNVIITNQRHFDALQKSLQSVLQVEHAVSSGIHTELLAYELRNALEQLGEISGEFTNDEVLGNIFSKFCIGK